jgi:hypothetical protein
LESAWSRVWADALIRDQKIPSGGASSISSTPSVRSHSSYGTPRASSAAANGPNHSGFSWMAYTLGAVVIPPGYEAGAAAPDA